jgi:transcriptional regulator with GAF, ATPase, and Fis domain
MSSAQQEDINKALRSALLDWAQEKESYAEEWMNELEKQKISDMQSLIKRAKSTRWPNTLEKLSDSLVRELKTGTAPFQKPFHKKARASPPCGKLVVNEEDESLIVYKDISTIIGNSSEIHEIENIIKMVESAASPIPFLFLAGSSGMGKTQTAQTIREKLKSQRMVLYFLGTLSDNSVCLQYY